MEQKLIWAHGKVYRQLDGIEPVLESWNKKTDPAQEKLRRYLEQLVDDPGLLGPPTKFTTLRHGSK